MVDIMFGAFFGVVTAISLGVILTAVQQYLIIYRATRIGLTRLRRMPSCPPERRLQVTNCAPETTVDFYGPEVVSNENTQTAA